MKLVLTDKVSGKELVVETDMIKLMEPDSEGTGSHIVFGADMGRVVVESLASIIDLLGASKPSVAVAALTKKGKKA